jgi:type VI protein secretion system component Hcp
VIVSSYKFHGSASGSPQPKEDVSMNYSKITWIYVKIDPRTGKNQGQAVGRYDPGAHEGS